jgi:hypothetical protein
MTKQKTEPFDQPGSLMARTIELLNGQDLLELYSETSIPYYWLRTFARGVYKNPSVNRVQFLYEYLTQKSLF